MKKKKYIKPECKIIELPQTMYSCPCGSNCIGDCKCHDSNWPDHNPHACDCNDGHGHGHHPENEEDI